MGSLTWLFLPGIAGMVAVAILGVSIRSILLYSRRAAEIRRKLKGMDREIAKWHDGTADKRQAVADLERIVAPLQEKESQLQAYHKTLEVLSLGQGKEAFPQEQAGKREIKVGGTRQQSEEKPKRKLEISLKKRGL